ncbi:MAG TPA: FG-GAP-like repeat-containing protein [Candidatus Eisenbacteria bacterium]|nr:FG-GAP-like repeat-containing protein [Candidatus Eisenbacteria bacterium]
MHFRNGRRVSLLVVAGSLVARLAAASEPVVVSTNPVRHTFAPAGTTIAITFDQAILPSSIDSASVRVFGRATGTAAGSFALSNANKTVTFTPTRTFSAGETVLVNLSHDVRAADSTPLRSAGYAFEFIVRSAAVARVYEPIDVMSNRTGGNGGPHTQIYGAVQTDLDGDGWIDLATVNETSADLRVFMNRGDGTGLYQPFLTPVPIGVESSPNEPADFDNDGKTDIVVSATDSGGVWILHGNGDGTFGGSQSILTGTTPHGVVVLDVDGDGDFDIVDAVEGDSQLALLLNDGSGTFGSPSYFDPGCSGPWGLASADMNNDGIIDLVAGCVIDERAAVLLGNGDGTFTGMPSQDAAGPPWQVAVGDVDGDGNVDAALGNAAPASNGALLHGNGDGTMALPVTVPMPGHVPASDLGDLDGDGDLDWVLSSYGAGLWRIYVNDGSGTFTFDQDIPAVSNPSCAVLLDFDNDGDIDLALSDEIADVVLLLRSTNGPNPLCPSAPAACRTTVLPRKSSFTLKDKSPDTRDQLVWKWAGQATPKADFGSPATTDDYALCIYDAAELVASATAGAGASWTDKPTSLVYKNTALTPDGTQKVLLKEGLVDGKAKIAFKGKGVPLLMPAPMSFTGPIAVRLHRSGGATCWGADFSPPFLKQDTASLSDKSD